MAKTRQERPPPHDELAEKSVLGSMMLSQNTGHKVIGPVMEVLEPEDFYRPRHGLIYDAICSLSRTWSVIDIVTVGDALGTRLNEECGGHKYLLEILETVPHAAHAVYYAKIVREKANIRRVREAMRLAWVAINEPSNEPETKRDAVANIMRAFEGERHLKKGVVK